MCSTTCADRPPPFPLARPDAYAARHTRSPSPRSARHLGHEWSRSTTSPHKIVSGDGKFAASPALDTNDRYAYRFTQPGRYDYFCGLHPKMIGAIVVTKAAGRNEDGHAGAAARRRSRLRY